MIFASVTLMLLLIDKRIAAVELASTFPEADALCEAQGLKAARVGNRCLVKSVGTAGNFSTIIHNACPPIVGLKNGRLIFPYSRPIKRVLSPWIGNAAYRTSTNAEVWTALVQQPGANEPAGGWSLQLNNGSYLDVPSDAIDWHDGQPDNSETTGDIPVMFGVLTADGQYKDVGGWDAEPNKQHWICEYEFVALLPVRFTEVSTGYILNSTLTFAQPAAINHHQCAHHCARAYICASLGFNHITKQCSLYWIHSEHVNFMANQIVGDANDAIWDLVP